MACELEYIPSRRCPHPRLACSRPPIVEHLLEQPLSPLRCVQQEYAEQFLARGARPGGIGELDERVEPFA
jgi:hypothetical protein